MLKFSDLSCGALFALTVAPMVVAVVVLSVVTSSVARAAPEVVFDVATGEPSTDPTLVAALRDLDQRTAIVLNGAEGALFPSTMPLCEPWADSAPLVGGSG